MTPALTLHCHLPPVPASLESIARKRNTTSCVSKAQSMPFLSTMSLQHWDNWTELLCHANPFLRNTAAVRNLFDRHSLPAFVNDRFLFLQVLSLCNPSHFIAGYSMQKGRCHGVTNEKGSTPSWTYNKRGEKFSYLLPLN